MQDLESLASEKIGGTENLDFYPKTANPFKNPDKFNNFRVVSYRFDEKEMDRARTNLYSVKRHDPKRKTMDFKKEGILKPLKSPIKRAPTRLFSIDSDFSDKKSQIVKISDDGYNLRSPMSI